MSEVGRYIISHLEQEKKHLLKDLEIFEVGKGGDLVNIRFSKGNMDLIWLSNDVIKYMEEQAGLYRYSLSALVVWSYPEMDNEPAKVELEAIFRLGGFS